MDQSQAVQTASKDQSRCCQCGATLPERPSAKEHRFCNAKCRAAWHRGAKQRALNAALFVLDKAMRLAAKDCSYGGSCVADEVLRELLHVRSEIVAAGAESP